MKKSYSFRIITLLMLIISVILTLSACGQNSKQTGQETDATSSASVQQTENPTAEPTTEPTAEPTTEPTAEPTAELTGKPTIKPSPIEFEDEDPEELPKTGKPVIYLYPEKPAQASVKLDYNGKLEFTYPAYNQGWNVLAKPDGTLTDLSDGKEYSYLFWEGVTEDRSWDLSKGFVVEGSKTAEFLQSKLSEIGLLPKEYNEFIVYWTPLMQNNRYNLITFQSEYYENLAKLDVQPNPDSMLRVFMVYKPLDKKIEIPAQTFPRFERIGFTLVEWGGTEVK